VTAGRDFVIVDESNHRIRLVEAVFPPGERISPPGEGVSPSGILGLELVVEAKKKQEPGKLSVNLACPQEGCTVAGEGKAKDSGVKSKLKSDEAQLQPGEAEKLKLGPKENIRELGGGKATIGILATDAEGDRASKHVKVKLKKG
jgi:hypothetical protein